METCISTHQLNKTQKSSPILGVFCKGFHHLWERKSDPPFTWATIVRSTIVIENSLAKVIEDWLK